MKVSRVAMENSLLVTTGKVLLELRLDRLVVDSSRDPSELSFALVYAF